MKLKPLFSLALAVLLSAAAVPGEAWAGPPTDIVKSKQTELFRLIEANKDGSSTKKIAAVFDELLDYDWLAKASLGDEWQKLGEKEQKEFSGLLKQLVQKAYERNLKKTLAYDIEYVAEEKVSDNVFVVKTKAKSKTDSREEPIEIAFRMGSKGGGKWQIEDINTEGVSLVDSYRSQFVKILKKDGYASLVAKMKEKIAKGA